MGMFLRDISSNVLLSLAIDISSHFSYWNLTNEIDSGECYCDKAVSPFPELAPDSDCSMTCNGNNNKTAQFCGGPGRFNMYYSKSVINPSKRWVGSASVRGMFKRWIDGEWDLF